MGVYLVRSGYYVPFAWFNILTGFPLIWIIKISQDAFKLNLINETHGSMVVITPVDPRIKQ